MDGEKLVVEDLGRQMLEPEVAKEKEAVFVPHRIMINKEDLEKYGYSAGCPGCKAILRGTARQGHSEACRSRIETELRDDPRMKAQKKRQEEFLTNKLEKQEEKRRKVETKEAVKDEGMGAAAAAASSALLAASSSSSTSAGPAPQMQEEQDQHREEKDEEMDTGKGEKREGVLWEELARRMNDAKTKNTRVDLVLNEALNQEDDDSREASLHIDTKTGKELDERAVAAARKEEIEFMRQIKLYDKVDWEECIRMTGRPPVSTKWVEVDKETAEKPDVRCRLVARDFRVKGEGHRDDLFAAMPPLEAKKLLFKLAAATRKGRLEGKELDKIMLIDVKKAHLNGFVGADVWACIELPEEDYEEGKCGRLRRWLYGMRPAAKAWEDDYGEKLESIGFLRGKAAPTTFHRPVWKVRIVVHGDDFTVTGKQQHLDMVKTAMRVWYFITVEGVMGPDAGDCKDRCILNRRLKIEGEFLSYEARPEACEDRVRRDGAEGGFEGIRCTRCEEDAAVAGTEEEPLGRKRRRGSEHWPRERNTSPRTGRTYSSRRRSYAVRCRRR